MPAWPENKHLGSWSFQQFTPCKVSSDALLIPGNLWLCLTVCDIENGHRNSWISHEKWWIFPSFFVKNVYQRLKWDKGGKAGFGDGTMSWTNHKTHNAADPFIVSFERGETSISPIKFHLWVKLSRKNFKPTIMEYTYNLAFIDTSQTIELPSFANCSIGISRAWSKLEFGCLMFTTLDVDCKSWKCSRNRQQQSKPPNLDHTCTCAYIWLNYDNSQTWIKVYSFRALCIANHDLPFWIGQQRRYKSDPLAYNPCMGFLQNRFHDNTLWSFNITMEPIWIGES